MTRQYDIVVVGTGFSGGIMARELAEQGGQKVLVVEQRSHIAGNMYDEIDENGILIQRYGPHFLCTDKYWIINYLEKFADLLPYTVKLLSHVDGKHVRLPFNFETVQQMVPPLEAERLLALFRHYFAGRDRVPIFELAEHENKDIRGYGAMLFEKAYKTYTAKMWGLDPSDVDRSVLNRVCVAMNYDERYLNRDFQRLPKQGFTKMFMNILDHPNIDVKLNVDALDSMTLDERSRTVAYEGEEYKHIVFTGAIDELFGHRFGSLPYRSLDIKYNVVRTTNALPAAVVSYPQAKDFVRKTEYRKICLYDLSTPYSVVATEYPLQYNKYAETGNLPYYPIISEDNNAVYNMYLDMANSYKNLLLCGRLAEYRYYNMDAVIESTFEKLMRLQRKLGIPVSRIAQPETLTSLVI